MIDDAERKPKLAMERLASNSDSPLPLNLLKVIEPCISCKVGWTICALYLIAAEEFKRGHVYMALESGKML